MGSKKKKNGVHKAVQVGSSHVFVRSVRSYVVRLLYSVRQGACSSSLNLLYYCVELHYVMKAFAFQSYQSRARGVSMAHALLVTDFYVHVLHLSVDCVEQQQHILLPASFGLS